MGWEGLVRTNGYCGYFSGFLFVCKGYREEGGGKVGWVYEVV